MKKVVLYFLPILLLAACRTNTKTFEESEQIGIFGIPKKIEFYRHVDGHAFLHKESAEFVITNDKDLKSIFSEICLADNSELRKGAGWDKLKIYFADTILELNTDQKNIGCKASGAFYSLQQDNFIKKHLERD